jgi:hypothetical protein
MKWPDDRVDPNGRTLSEINARRSAPSPYAVAASGSIASSVGPIDTLGPNPYLVPLLIALVPEARIWVQKSIYNLDQASGYFNSPLPGRGGAVLPIAVRRLNWHFKLDEHPHRRKAFHLIQMHFHRMRQWLLPGDNTYSQYLAVFEPNPFPTLENRYLGYTWPSGYQQKGTKEPSLRIRMDRIYVSERVVHGHRHQIIMLMIHELAHFVSDSGSGQSIMDFGYGWITDKRMKQVPAYHRVRTAACYENFALSCFYQTQDDAETTPIPAHPGVAPLARAS